MYTLVDATGACCCCSGLDVFLCRARYVAFLRNSDFFQGMSKLALALLALFCLASANAEVLVLKSPQELADAIAIHPRLIVKFYAPW